MVKLKQALTETELLSYIGALQVNIQLANKNIQILMDKNAELEQTVAEQRDALFKAGSIVQKEG
jgi:hypothetical protein